MLIAVDDVDGEVETGLIFDEFEEIAYVKLLPIVVVIQL